MTFKLWALSGSEIAAIYSAGGAGKCKTDVDNDGLPDWWELQNFGTLIWSSTNLDSNGNSLLDDYTYNMVPANVIQFTIEVANNYVNTANTPAQIALASGFPYSIAISVDDTNFEADAVWTPYTSGNIIVPLGATEGWHDVWIGLLRYGDDPSAAVWVWKRLKLDTTPPALVITGPTNGTVNVPMIQLTGYSPEALASINYDLTNALGLVTDQQVLVLDQAYSTKTWEFTTNTFQAFDMPLTNGVNTITLHATDLAGNTATLTTNITLDYSSKTNPPMVQLYWPQDGAQICGSTFTWRGHVDDSTAQLTAQIVDASGNTNIVPALVERDGDWWAENVPLPAGANELTLTATDAVGNSFVTNITVFQSAVTLTMIVPTGDELWNPTVTVTGTISDPDNYMVWVNGMEASYTDGNGDWEADNVPTTPGGTAVFQARAIPDTDNGGNGTGGSGGTMASYADPGNPSSAQAQDADSQGDKPPRIYQESYTESDGGSIVDTGPSDYHYTYTREGFYGWTNAEGGYGSLTRVLQQSDDSTWLVSQMTSQLSTPPQGSGTEVYNWYYADDTPYQANGEDTYPWTPLVLSEHSNVQPHVDGNKYPADFGMEAYCGWTYNGGLYTVKGNYHRTADAVWKLQTGGKAGSKRLNLFCISATATEVLDPYAEPYCAGLQPLADGSGQWWINGGVQWIGYEPLGLPPLTQTIPSEDIRVDGHPLDSNGNLWMEFPDNWPPANWPFGGIDVTPWVPGKDFYTFTVGQHKYLSHFKVFVREPYPGLVNPNYPKPPPDGYPNKAPLVGYGHTWWEMTTEAPLDAVNKFTSANCSRWLNQEVGYGPLTNSIWSSFGFVGPGQLPYPNGSATTTKTYEVGIQAKGVIDALNYTESVNQHPGTFFAPFSDCVSHTIDAGNAAGLALPNTWYPEQFGEHLPPND